MRIKPTTTYIVIPCYNEEAVLPETARRVFKKITSLIQENMISPESRICFVDDGSVDRTWNIICQLHETDSLFTGIKLSRNRGHQNALLAGLMTAKDYADAVISMDADLQDDIEIIAEMLKQYHQGFDIVYGTRSLRKKDTFFKRFTAEGYYKLLRLMGVEIIYNHADFRLMSKRSLNGLAEFEEVNLFLRGLVPLIGYPYTTVSYERNERYAGSSKYPVKKMLSFAFDGITSLSIRPIRIIANMGFLISVISFGFFMWSIITHIFGFTVAGWTSILASIWLVGGLEMLALGVIGEYIGKIYSETKKRPRYIVEMFLDEADRD